MAARAKKFSGLDLTTNIKKGFFKYLETGECPLFAVPGSPGKQTKRLLTGSKQSRSNDQ